MSNPSPILEAIHSEILRLHERLDSIEQASGARPSVPLEYLSLDDAALALGRSKRAVQSLLARDAQDPSGIHPRRIRGAVHREDWRRFLEAKRLKGSSGLRVRAALDEKEAR